MWARNQWLANAADPTVSGGKDGHHTGSPTEQPTELGAGLSALATALSVNLAEGQWQLAVTAPCLVRYGAAGLLGSWGEWVAELAESAGPV